MTSKKNRNAIPSGNSRASGTRAPPGTIDVYSVSLDGSTKTYLGWVTDKNKLAFFSRAGDRAINPHKYSKYGSMGLREDPPPPAKRPFPVHELLLGPNVDKVAAEIVIAWINGNDINNPKNFVLDYALFGDTPPSFETALKVHHAMHAFDLYKEHRGQVVRNAIMDYIYKRGDPMVPDAADFKHCMEKIDFDGGVLSAMRNQTMWRSVNNRIDPAVLDEIKLYCWEDGSYRGMQRIGDEVVAKKLSCRTFTTGKSRKLEHGWD